METTVVLPSTYILFSFHISMEPTICRSTNKVQHEVTIETWMYLLTDGPNTNIENIEKIWSNINLGLYKTFYKNKYSFVSDWKYIDMKHKTETIDVAVEKMTANAIKECENTLTRLFNIGYDTKINFEFNSSTFIIQLINYTAFEDQMYDCRIIDCISNTGDGYNYIKNDCNYGIVTSIGNVQKTSSFLTKLYTKDIVRNLDSFGFWLSTHDQNYEYIKSRFMMSTDSDHQVVSQSIENIDRGALIVVEGCDKSGKTTQCQKLVEHLNTKGIKSVLWKFPNRDTATGVIIDDYLKKQIDLEDHAIHLLFAANRWESVPKMEELLKSGTTLIVDRYAFSGVAFSSAKNGLDFNWCQSQDIGLPKPDCVIYLSLNPKDAAKRIGYGKEKYEEIDFQLKVEQNFYKLHNSSWKIIDASLSIPDINTSMIGFVEKVIDECKSSPISLLGTVM